MSKQEEAGLILKLYELRRDETMRKARDWFFRDFHPESLTDLNDTMLGEHSAHLRMVMSYWEMAATLVAHGAIDAKLFNEANSEHLGVFAKLQPLLSEIRSAYGAQFMVNLEKVVTETPGAQERLEVVRGRMKGIRAEAEKRRSKASGS
jgi:hypothetical protein